MKIIADSNIPSLDCTFGRHGEIVLLDGRDICRSDLANADILLVRSVTRVGEDILAGTNIRFVGSATIGIDHLDTAWLDAQGIAWANAPGCNADAAAQYTLAMMWLACDRLGKDFKQQSVGIIGRGNVGRRLEHLLKVLHISVMCCDPPLQDLGELQLVSMDEVCDNTIISLHVPLTTDGKHPTRHLFDQRALGLLKPKTLMVNASRGGVIEGRGLLRHLQSGHIYAALDVWPDEPHINQHLLDLVSVATPHVAGYSCEGKLAGTSMIYSTFCEALGFSMGKETIRTKIIELKYTETPPGQEVSKQAILSSSQLERDDKALRHLSPSHTGDNRLHIDNLRTAYPERFEFKSHSVCGISDTDAKLLQQLGFSIS